MTGIQPMHFCLGKILEIGLTTLWSKKDIALSPKDDRLGLALTEKGLPFRVERHIGAVVVEEIQLHPSRIRALQEGEVGVPVVGADQFRPFGAVQVNGLDRVEFEQARYACFGFGCSVHPKCASETCPSGREADLICVCVLND